MFLTSPVVAFVFVFLFSLARSSPLDDDPSEFIAKSPRKVHISDTLYQQMVTYTTYSVACKAAQGECKQPPFGSAIVGYFSIKKKPIADTQVTIYQHDPTNEFIVAFPGTMSAIDSRGNERQKLVPFITTGVTKSSCKGCKVRQGTFQEWEVVADPLSTKLKSLISSNPSYQITVTGHSLGAGLASLCTASLRGQGLPVAQTFTFGEFRVGNPAYADHIDKINGATAKKAGTYYRVTHANDGVPHGPPQSKGYRHSRTEYWQKPRNHESAQTTFRCFGQEPDNCNDSTMGKGVNHAHGMYSGLSFSAASVNMTCGMNS